MGKRVLLFYDTRALSTVLCNYTASHLNGPQNSQPSLVKAANSAALSGDLVCRVHLSCHHRNCVAVQGIVMNQHIDHTLKNRFIVVCSVALLAACVAPGCGSSNDTSGDANNRTAGGASPTAGGSGIGTSGNNGSGMAGSAIVGASGSGAAAGLGGASGFSGASAGGGMIGTAGNATSNAGSAGMSNGGASTGGASAGGTSGANNGGASAAGSNAGGAGGATVHESSSCSVPTWPTAVGSAVTISGTKSVSGTYDGKMALHNGNLNDCTTGDQSSTQAIIEIADGGSVKNIIFGTHVGDGIHCLGSCTIDNVWFPYICDDAITMLGGSGKTATITNSGFKNARDKTIQHNGDGSTVALNNIYVETAGKLYRSCGQGCSSSAKRNATISNVTAIGASQIAGVSTNDKVTLSNICTYRTPSICRTYKPGTETETTIGANGTDEGPDANCIYKSTDTHALLNDVTGNFQTDALCPGPNSVKVGSTATACITGFDSCLKGCAPGSYGFRQAICASGVYADSGSCGMPSDAATLAHFASSNAASATATVTNNDPCTTEWAWANDGAGKYCMCVPKPGYYQASSGWWVWDCQSQWW
jgi:hypothetical protein